jgi:hypothetical protein
MVSALVKLVVSELVLVPPLNRVEVVMAVGLVSLLFLAAPVIVESP